MNKNFKQGFVNGKASSFKCKTSGIEFVIIAPDGNALKKMAQILMPRMKEIDLRKCMEGQLTNSAGYIFKTK